MAFPFLFSIIILSSLASFLFIAYMRIKNTSPSPSSSFSTSCFPSCSSSIPGSSYDVFLSFRGEDTRNNFVGHLYKELDRYGIYTFKDDEKLKRGKSISPALLKAIQDSRFSVVVVSENYATSSWCLDELVKIIECMDQFGQTVVPIFYNVNPSHVKKQTGSFAKAFASHEKTFKNEREKVLRWREALRRVATISGWDSLDRDESMLIEDIVGDISDRLFSESSSDDSKLVGMGYHIQQMNSGLFIDSDDVRMVGIWGMGGIGKTTIATAIYDRFSRQYESRCSIANVKDIFKNHPPKFLQEKLLSEILSERNLNIHTLGGGSNVIKERLSHKKVFIVLDDVDKLEQLETLAGMHDWFGTGSRIIITTRDKHLLVTHGVNYIYEVENLKDGEALQLLMQYAFKHDHPTVEYLELSNHFVSYTKGLPLALKVLGSFLYSKTISEWKSELVKLQRIPNAEIQDVLRISYDGLNDDKQKGMFLDIACFFKGEDKDFVMNILESCGFFTDTDLRVLIDKSLITISDSKLWVHDLVQEMGWEVVRQESVKDPGKRSRLWDPEDVYRVLKYNTGTEMIEGIFLDTSKIKALHLNNDTFKRMYNLRLLKVYNSDYYRGFKENCKVHFPQGLDFLSDELRYLYWHRYPLKSLPSNFHPENLVELNMHYSNLERLWEGVEHLMKLKRIELSHSQHLTGTSDLSEARKLECIILEGCTSLLEVHSSIQYLNKLIVLNLKDCEDLRSPPETAGLESLKDLTLSGCSYIKKSPEIPGSIKHLCLDRTSIEELPRSFEYSLRLVTLNLKNCKFLASLPNSFCNLKSLKYLTLSGCSKVSRLPENFGNLTSLVRLEAEEIGIKLLPSSITCLKRLLMLSLRGCKGEDSTGLLLPPLSGLCYLEKLNLSDCNLFELPEDLGSLSWLKDLDLGRNNFEIIAESIKQLHRLESVRLRECKRLRSIPRLPPSIKVMDAHNCTSLETVSKSSCECDLIEFISNSTYHGSSSASFIFTNCFKLNQNARINIMADAQEKIQVVANASSELCSQGEFPRKSVRICYPGSEIPEWFTHQSMGSSVTIQLPPHSNSKFIGFAVCVVVAFEDYCGDVNFTLEYECCLKMFDGLLEDNGTSFIDRWFYRKDEPRFIGSDHVLLGYRYPIACPLLEDVCAEGSIEFCITYGHENRSHLQCCRVKKCGVRPLYQVKTNEEFDGSESGNGSASSDTAEYEEVIAEVEE